MHSYAKRHLYPFVICRNPTCKYMANKNRYTLCSTCIKKSSRYRKTHGTAPRGDVKYKEEYLRRLLGKKYTLSKYTTRGKSPDYVIKKDNGSYIFIECDEYQHLNYKNEKKRMDIIGNGISSIFIRFNPDEYIDDEDHYPLLYMSLDGKITMNPDEIDRLALLYNTIDLYLNKTITDTCIIYMFYDKS